MHVEQLRRGLPGYFPQGITPRYTVTPQAARLPTWNPPTGDERLTGADSELAQRLPQVVPTVNADPVVPIVTEQANPVMESPYESTLARLRAVRNAPVEDDLKRSALYGAGTAMSDTAQSGSLGRTVGAGLMGAVSGLVNKKLYGEAKKQAELSRIGGDVQVEAALDKQARDRIAQEADTKLKEAQRKNTESLPTYRTEEQRRKEEDSQRRFEGLERRLDITDAYNRGRLGQGERKIDETIRSHKKGEEDRDADRASRERVAKWLTGSRESIAAANRTIQQDRLNLNRQEFGAKYPGAGKTLTKDAIIQKAKQMKMLPEDVVSDAVKQGYQIEQ